MPAFLAAIPAIVAVVAPIVVKATVVAAKAVGVATKVAAKTAVVATKAVAKGAATVAKTTGKVAMKVGKTVGRAAVRVVSRVTKAAGRGAKSLAQESIEANQQNIEQKPITSSFSQAKATGAKMAQSVLGTAEAGARLVAATRPSRVLAPPAVARRRQAARESTVRSSPAVQRVPAKSIASAAPAVTRSKPKTLPRGQAAASTVAMPPPGGRRGRPEPAQQPVRGPGMAMS